MSNTRISFLLSVSAIAISAAVATALPQQIQITEMASGSGQPAIDGSQVALCYESRLPDGTRIFSSTGRPPLVVTLGGPAMIPGMSLGVIGMRQGGVRDLEIPASLAYGSRGLKGRVPPATDLLVRVHLVRILARDAPSSRSQSTDVEPLGDLNICRPEDKPAPGP